MLTVVGRAEKDLIERTSRTLKLAFGILINRSRSLISLFSFIIPHAESFGLIVSKILFIIRLFFLFFH